MAAERTIGAALGKLVVAHQQGAFDVEAIAADVLQKWSAREGATVTFEATALSVDGEAQLSLEDPDGRWLLPCFMSGLRELRLAEEGTEVADLLRLAEELASVRATNESVEHLRDWLWMDGAEGFEVEVEASFTEALDAAYTDPETKRQEILAMRAEAAQSLSADAIAVATRDLDAAAVRDEMGVSLDALAESAARGEFDVDADQRAALARACESAAYWIRAQIDYVLANPALQPSLSTQKLSRTVVKQAREWVDVDLLTLLAEVTHRPEPYAAELTQAFEREHVGAAIAATVRIDPETDAPLRTLLGGDRSRLSQELAHGLLERSSREPQLLDATTSLVTTVGLNRFWKQLDLTTLERGGAGTLTRILPQADPSPAIVRDLLRNPKVAGPLLGALPPASFARFGDDLRKFLTDAPTAEIDAVVEGLSTAEGQPLELLGAALVARHGAGLKKPTLDKAVASLVARGHAQQFVLPLARDPAAEWPNRLAALRALARQPELFAEAVRWTAAEVREPAEVRAWLKAARKEGGLPRHVKAGRGAGLWITAAALLAVVAGAVGTVGWTMRTQGLTAAEAVTHLRERLTGGAPGTGAAPPPAAEPAAPPPAAVLPTAPDLPGEAPRERGSRATRAKDFDPASLGKSKSPPVKQPAKPAGEAGGNGASRGR